MLVPVGPAGPPWGAQGPAGRRGLCWASSLGPGGGTGARRHIRVVGASGAGLWREAWPGAVLSVLGSATGDRPGWSDHPPPATAARHGSRHLAHAAWRPGLCPPAFPARQGEPHLPHTAEDPGPGQERSVRVPASPGDTLDPDLRAGADRPLTRPRRPDRSPTLGPGLQDGSGSWTPDPSRVCLRLWPVAGGCGAGLSLRPAPSPRGQRMAAPASSLAPATSASSSQAGAQTRSPKSKGSWLSPKASAQQSTSTGFAVVDRSRKNRRRSTS